MIFLEKGQRKSLGIVSIDRTNAAEQRVFRGIDACCATFRHIGTSVHSATACRSSSFGQVDCEGGPVGAQARLRVRNNIPA